MPAVAKYAIGCRMGKIYRFLGLSVAVVKSTDPPLGRGRLFKCDIVYVTAQSLCFTYLQDNTAIYKESVVSAQCSGLFLIHLRFYCPLLVKIVLSTHIMSVRYTVRMHVIFVSGCGIVLIVSWLSLAWDNLAQPAIA